MADESTGVVGPILVALAAVLSVGLYTKYFADGPAEAETRAPHKHERVAPPAEKHPVVAHWAERGASMQYAPFGEGL